jgi:Rod binding domain-containing protein
MSDIDNLAGLAMPVGSVASSVSTLRPVRDTIGGPATAEKAARDFESVLLQQLFQEMRKTVDSSGLLESNEDEQVQGIFWSYLAQDVADKGGIGLWKELARKMNQAQAGENTPTVEVKA